MTTLILHRTDKYASVLAREASRGRSPSDVKLLRDAEDLGQLLASHPNAVVVIDEGSVESERELEQLIRSWPDARFVVLVADQPSDVNYLRAGARAVLGRAEALAALRAALTAVDAGLCALPPPLVHLMLRPVPARRPSASEADLLARLSPREHEILLHLASGRDSAAIADALGLSVHTVRSHLKGIFRKLDVHSSVEAVVVAVSAGLAPGAADRR